MVDLILLKGLDLLLQILLVLFKIIKFVPDPLNQRATLLDDRPYWSISSESLSRGLIYICNSCPSSFVLVLNWTGVPLVVGFSLLLSPKLSRWKISLLLLNYSRSSSVSAIRICRGQRSYACLSCSLRRRTCFLRSRISASCWLSPLEDLILPSTKYLQSIGVFGSVRPELQLHLWQLEFHSPCTLFSCIISFFFFSQW